MTSPILLDQPETHCSLPHPHLINPSLNTVDFSFSIALNSVSLHCPRARYNHLLSEMMSIIELLQTLLKIFLPLRQNDLFKAQIWWYHSLHKTLQYLPMALSLKTKLHSMPLTASHATVSPTLCSLILSHMPSAPLCSSQKGLHSVSTMHHTSSCAAFLPKVPFLSSLPS